ncbi:MAG: response regulator [Candidatus Thiodiazotropha sp. (ex Semelilucina semeliformis)]|nr:response regulator [Candidatus Thiodiazotropha sp. (ex Myrtea spinifera)]MCU7808274.1 response regulator [Candidatus Thiodiazotropha sp. (ex Semelilucina semeliformis)]MCU7830325.1 response regulator [Candidatus Thiodiazotropha sp. (ex Myrtea sp. 'scaly one' KF741663)]
MYYKPWKKLYLSPGNTSKILGVTPATLRGWTNRGILRAETTEGGHRRYPVSEVLRLAKRKGISLDLPEDFSLRILIVDDDEQFSLFIKEYLDDLPEVSSVEMANSGYMAGNLIPRFKPDVVLLDLKMPGLDGFEVCRIIKADQETRFIRVIAMSGFCTNENRLEITQAGAETCLSKPFPAEALKQALGLSVQTVEREVLVE